MEITIAKLVDSKIGYTIKREFNYQGIREGFVISQSIAPLAKIDSSAEILLTISKGEDSYSIFESRPSDEEYEITSIKQYRYKSKEVINSTTKPSSPTSFTLNSSTPTGKYTGWVDGTWSDSQPSISDSNTEKLSSKDQYRFYYFACDAGHRKPYCNTKCDSCALSVSVYSYNETWIDSAGTSLSYSNYNGDKKIITLDGQKWFFESAGTSNGLTNGTTGQPNKKLYCKSTRAEFIDYIYLSENWSD